VAGERSALSAFVADGAAENGAFREMIEALPIAIYTTDAQGRLTYYKLAQIAKYA
jgi:hypothetical protein